MDSSKNKSNIEVHSVSDAINVFSGNILSFQANKETNKNIFLSAFNISTALAMTLAGAEGATKTEMINALSVNNLKGDIHQAFKDLRATLTASANQGIKLTIANSIWIDTTCKLTDAFIKILNGYKAEPTTVNFKKAEQAANEINTWVSKHTNNLIKNIIPPGAITDITKLILVSAIYFKGPWLVPFEKLATSKHDFKLLDGNKSSVDMMFQTFDFRYGKTDLSSFVYLPYKGNKTYMLVMLPNKDGIAGLGEVGTAGHLNQALHASFQVKEVNLYLPKFKTDYEFSVVEAMKSLGMLKAFQDADFSAMSDSDSLYVSEIFHKAFVSVDEEGTEAAAATAVIMDSESEDDSPPQPIVFRVDRPFLFAIIHESSSQQKEMLFLGRIVDPKF